MTYKHQLQVSERKMLRESMDLKGSNSWYQRTYWCQTVGYCQEATWMGNNRERIHSCKIKDLLEGVHSIMTYGWQYGWSWRGGWRWMKRVSNFGAWGSEPLGSIKGKAIPVQALRVPQRWGSQISRPPTHEGGKVVSPKHQPPLPKGNTPGTHFC